MKVLNSYGLEYNAPSQWLRRKHMSQFSDRIFWGYQVSVRPHGDFLRKVIIPKWNISFMPYFAGADIVFKLKIKPTKSAISCSDLKYEWYLFKKDDEEPCELGLCTTLSPVQVHENLINLKHFSYTNEYRLDLKVTANERELTQTVADFEITSRASVQLTFVWTMIGFIVGFILGKVS